MEKIKITMMMNYRALNLMENTLSSTLATMLARRCSINGLCTVEQRMTNELSLIWWWVWGIVFLVRPLSQCTIGGFFLLQHMLTYDYIKIPGTWKIAQLEICYTMCFPILYNSSTCPFFPILGFVSAWCKPYNKFTSE